MTDTPRPSIQTLRTVTTTVDVEDGTRSGALSDVLTHTFIQCQSGAARFPVSACVHCPRVVSIAPDPKRVTVTVRCLWREDDLIDRLMTRAAALITVCPETSIAQATRAACDHGLHHLVVVDNDRFVGLVCRCDLAPPAKEHDTVAARMHSKVWALRPDDSLADAVELMASRSIGCVPVVGEYGLCGVITRSDLVHAGFDPHAVARSARNDVHEPANS